jgi:hypothetical protein
MQSKQPERVYIDSNVWFSYITEGKYDKQPEKARRIIDNIMQDNGSKAVISHLVLLEIINSLRKRMPEKEKFRGRLKDSPQLASSLEKTIENCVKGILDKITRWEGAGKLIIVDVRRPMTDIFKDAFLIHRNTFGRLGDSQQCRICKGSYTTYYYKGIDHWDIQHALIAREGRATHFDTFDGGFDQIRNYFEDSFVIQIL